MDLSQTPTITLIDTLRDAALSIQFRMETGKDLAGFHVSATELAAVAAELQRRGY